MKITFFVFALVLVGFYVTTTVYAVPACVRVEQLSEFLFANNGLPDNSTYVPPYWFTMANMSRPTFDIWMNFDVTNSSNVKVTSAINYAPLCVGDGSNCLNKSLFYDNSADNLASANFSQYYNFYKASRAAYTDETSLGFNEANVQFTYTDPNTIRNATLYETSAISARIDFTNPTQLITIDPSSGQIVWPSFDSIQVSVQWTYINDSYNLIYMSPNQNNTVMTACSSNLKLTPKIIPVEPVNVPTIPAPIFILIDQPVAIPSPVSIPIAQPVASPSPIKAPAKLPSPPPHHRLTVPTPSSANRSGFYIWFNGNFGQTIFFISIVVCAMFALYF
jgi:hypothetical protein